MGLNRECMDKPYLIGRVTAIVERLVDVPSDFVAMVQVNPLQKLTYHLKEALKKGDEELMEIANAIGDIPSPFVDPKAQFYIGYYHQKCEFNNIAFRSHIGQKITQIRKDKGLTQEQLSAMTGLDRANIAKIEKGRYNTGIDIIGKICDALGCRIDIVKNLGEYVLSKSMKEELINQFKKMSVEVDARGNLDNLKEEQ